MCSRIFFDFVGDVITPNLCITYSHMADKGNKKSLFWTSYSDLMTSLFFAMLVLFVVVVVAMGKANHDLQNTIKVTTEMNEQLNQILQLKDQFNTLSSSTSLKYDNQKRMFYAKDFIGIEIFTSNSDTIKQEYLETVDKVGNDIKQLIDNLKVYNKNFNYQLVIEGTAAIPYAELKAGTFNPDNYDMYLLSYKRALALYERWKKLDFRNSNTEIIIAGSGFNGINRDEKNENNNKRFVVQIIPKIDKPSEKK